MEELRPRNNRRYLSSFLLAVALHAVLFLLGQGSWGQPSGLPAITLIYSRVVEVETPPVTKIEPKPQIEPKPKVKEEQPARVEKPKSESKPPNKTPQEKVEKKAKTTEAVQEKPAARQVPPPEQEKTVSSAEQVKTKTSSETEPERVNEAKEEAPAEQAPPPLPPLGNGLQMMGIHRTFYPKDLQDQGVEGAVRLEIYVKEDGSLLRDPVIKKSSGHPKLDEHCIKTVKDKRLWQFKPAPQSYKLVVELRFSQDKVEEPRFLEEAAYLSPEEGGTSE